MTKTTKAILTKVRKTLEITALALIVLKLTGTLNISWTVALSPIWGAWVIGIAVIAVVVATKVRKERA